MRLLFVSGTTIGGSGRSQRELAKQLTEFGHEVLFLVDPERSWALSSWLYQHLADMAVKVDGHRIDGLVRMVERIPGRVKRRMILEGLTHVTSPVPENAANAVIRAFRPDIVVGSSVPRLAWRKVARMCAERDIPTILYIREEVALNHFEGGQRPADEIVANAESLQRSIIELGTDCSFIPSAIDTRVTATDSTRQVVLMINPITSRGVDVIWALAQQMPNVRFVLQESWPLDDAQLAIVRTHLDVHRNVELRRSKAPGPDLYGDARVLVVPYLVDNRPRVIAEAQANGIPVLAADVPALAEAVGAGGFVAPLVAIDTWCEYLRRLMDDEQLYERMCQAAVQHSLRDEISVESVGRRFEDLATALVASGSQGPKDS